MLILAKISPTEWSNLDWTEYGKQLGYTDGLVDGVEWTFFAVLVSALVFGLWLLFGGLTKKGK